MSTSTTVHDDQPKVGDLYLYDEDRPGIDAGEWTISITNTLRRGEPGPGASDTAEDPIGTFNASQAFVVRAPQVSLDPAEVVSVYPPSGSTARYAEVLPHVVLREPVLPWERAFSGKRPWLALLVLSADELIGGGSSPTGLTSTTVAGFKGLADAWVPDITIEPDIEGSDPCAYIEIAATTFAAVMPRLDELSYLAHCRRSSIADKAAGSSGADGLCSVVVANRFPDSPAAGQPAVNTVVHLVSVEGFADKLVDTPDFGGKQTVAMLSLKSWTFLCQADRPQDFRALGEALVAPGKDLSLRLPCDLPGSDAGAAEARTRLKDGYVPLPYKTRVGAETMAWYRGPLAPVLPAKIGRAEPLLSADGALVYQPAFGVFDASAATAWTAGRAAALADKGFGQALLAFRRSLHRRVDEMLVHVEGEGFIVRDLAAIEPDRLIQEDFAATLDADLLHRLSKAQVRSDATRAAAASKAASAPPARDARAAIQGFIGRQDVQARIRSSVEDELVPVARWLARLSLLDGLPFDLLVPDARLLPVESLRFFYLDQGWIDAAVDGALSVGLESSRDTLVHGFTAGIVKSAAAAAAAVLRAELIGADPPASEPSGLMTGFLLCSGIVAGWPNLAVRPRSADGSALKILRLDHLSRNVLIGIFAGAPDVLTLSEPQEGLRFGLDDDGGIPLRRPVVAGDGLLGAAIENTPPLPVRSRYLRSTESRVLALLDGADGGLVPALKSHLTAALSNTASGGLTQFGSADLALQMVKAPEFIQLSIKQAIA